MVAIILALVLGLQSKPHVYSRVDMIELNHFYDDLGRHAYDQVIFWEWSPDYRRYNVVAWCLVEDNLARVPAKHSSGDWVVKWHDRDQKAHREIRSRIYRETWGQVDPERENKKLIDERIRSQLARPGGH